MATVTALTRDGSTWTPKFVASIDRELCVGCGRCFKVCAQDVLVCDETDEEDSVKMFMKIDQAGKCIGCQACGRTCTKKAFRFESLDT